MNHLQYLVEEIHTTVVATVDECGLPVTCAIDLMDWDENGAYFLTAKGKGFYNRLAEKQYLALTGMKGEDTMSCVAVSVRGKVREIGPDRLPVLFEKNPYMAQIYSTEISRQALTVFQLYEGSGEWFDLSKKPIERKSFTIGNTETHAQAYRITDVCTGCGACVPLCPQNCIKHGQPYAIEQKHCLYCGNCVTVCPVGAVEH